MTKYWDPPLFSPKFFFTKMAQNGLKWILNMTLKTVKFFIFLRLPLVLILTSGELLYTFIALKKVYGMYHSLNIRYCNIVFVWGKEGLSVKQFPERF